MLKCSQQFCPAFFLNWVQTLNGLLCLFPGWPHAPSPTRGSLALPFGGKHRVSPSVHTSRSPGDSLVPACLVPHLGPLPSPLPLSPHPYRVLDLLSLCAVGWFFCPSGNREQHKHFAFFFTDTRRLPGSSGRAS